MLHVEDAREAETPTVLRIDRTVTMYIICVPTCIKTEADFCVKWSLPVACHVEELYTIDF